MRGVDDRRSQSAGSEVRQIAQGEVNDGSIWESRADREGVTLCPDHGHAKSEQGESRLAGGGLLEEGEGAERSNALAGHLDLGRRRVARTESLVELQDDGGEGRRVDAEALGHVDLDRPVDRDGVHRHELDRDVARGPGPPRARPDVAVVQVGGPDENPRVRLGNVDQLLPS
eukprot:768672-Hanusia_phi.AAC.5